MDELSPRLRRLDRVLSRLNGDCDPMTLSQLDGFIAGILLCPEHIPNAEWLPLVWGDADRSVFAGNADMQRLSDMVAQHVQAVSLDLHRMRGDYAPIFDIDARHDEVLWELWIDGFEAAIGLRPESWDAISRDGGVAAEALAGMRRLMMIAQRECDLPTEMIDALTAEAPDLISVWIEMLAAWRQEHHGAASMAVMSRAKIGRNEPCPCGSGRKYKKCCILD